MLCFIRGRLTGEKGICAFEWDNFKCCCGGGGAVVCCFGSSVCGGVGVGGVWSC